MGEFDYSNLAENRAKARRYRWTATAKARVTHERYGSVIVPHRSNYTAIENAAEFWRCPVWEIISSARVERVDDAGGPVRRPKEFYRQKEKEENGQK